MDDIAALISDFTRFAPAFLKIAVKTATGDGLVPFVLNRAQLYFNSRLDAQLKATGKVRALVLKGRQQGISTDVQGRNFHNLITSSGKKAYVMAHEGDASDNLFKITRRFYDNLPAGLCPTASKLNMSEMEFAQFSSSYAVGTAGSKRTGRSQTIHLFHGCLSGDSLIVLADGSSKSMRDISIGDQVVTSSGSKAPVKNKIYTGKKLTFELSCWNSGEPIYLTYDHKVLTQDGYKTVSELTKYDFVAMPKMNPGQISDFTFNLKNIPRPQGGGTSHIEKHTFKLNYDFGYFIGYYLAEGHIDKNLSRITFTYHKDEGYIENALRGTQGLEKSITHKVDLGTNRKRTVVSGKFLASAIESLVGRVRDKHISWVILNSDKEFLSGMFKGYLDGDGSKTQLDKITAPSIHEKITRQMQRICWMLYGACSINQFSRKRYDVPSKDIYLLRITGNTLRRFERQPSKLRQEKSIIKDDIVYCRVKNIKIRYIEDVWDIEIDHPDHNYQTSVGMVSNSEVAFWENTEELATGVMEAVSDAAGTEIVLESTANGQGNDFHQRWLSAMEGKSDYQAIFIPWYWQDEYKLPLRGFKPNDQEQELFDAFGKDGLTLEHLAWRRIKLQSMNRDEERALEMFCQEYPFTAAEAFRNPIANTFIKPRWVTKARHTDVETDVGLIVGVDPADDKDGSDRTAIIKRRGRRVYDLKTYRNHNVMEIAGILVDIIRRENPVKVYIDCIGLGKGIVDRLLEQGYACTEGINVSLQAHNKERFANRRAELWSECADWLMQDMPVELPDSDELQSDLCSVGFKHKSNGQLLIESKADLKKRHMPSPDCADALIHTFSGGFYEISANMRPTLMPEHHRKMFT